MGSGWKLGGRPVACDGDGGNNGATDIDTDRHECVRVTDSGIYTD